jgi:hypothetical protein
MGDHSGWLGISPERGSAQEDGEIMKIHERILFYTKSGYPFIRHGHLVVVGRNLGFYFVGTQMLEVWETFLQDCLDIAMGKS